MEFQFKRSETLVLTSAHTILKKRLLVAPTIFGDFSTVEKNCGC